MSGEISLAIVYSPIAWIALTLSASGFLLMQLALRGYVSKVIPIVTGVAILASVLPAFVFLGEPVSYFKSLGIFLVLIGIFGLVKTKG